MQFKRNNIINKFLYSIIILNISACSNIAYKKSLLNKKRPLTNKYTQKQDGHPNRIDIPDLASIKDPVPIHEPLSNYGNMSKYKVFNKTYKVLKSSDGFKQRGYASWYGTKFHGFRTSSGETYDMYAMTAAHKTLPLPTYAKVTNLSNRRSIIVKVNDRGPFHGDRIIDLSYVAASKLGIIGDGVAKVEVVAVTPRNNNVKINNDTKLNLKSKSNIQLGAFKQQTNAKNLADRLEKILRNQHKNYMDDYKINIISEKNDLKKSDKDNTLYKVVISSINGELDTNKLKKILKINGAADEINKIFINNF